MSQIDTLVGEFLSQRRIAVVGVSATRETGANANYRNFKQAGYTVYAINPHIDTFEGDPCFPTLAATPEKPQAVFILASPAVTEEIVHQCLQNGVEYVWMHCMMGVKPGLAAEMTSVSPAAVRLCRENGVKVIPGSCPAQFLNPDFGHRIMRGLWRLMGNMKIEDV